MSRFSVLLLLSLLASGKASIRGTLSQPFVGEEQRQSITSPQRGLQVDALCTLKIATYRCDEVVATAVATGQIFPIDGCDCYNFCGDTYNGCCAAGGACGIAACDTDLVPVAGCRLDGVIDTTPDDAVCAVTLADGTVTQFSEGQSFGDLVPGPCSPAADYPCECRTLSEDDGIRCPYCPFLTQNQDTVCARDGESVTFINTDGISQTCSCDYLGNNEVGVFCESVNPPQERCILQGNTDQCAEVTEFANPMEGCDCYNFCDGKFTGCCKYDEACSATCDSNNPVPDAEFVRGCEIDPNKPPVTPPPIETTDAPAQSPPSCPVQQNTELCPTLTENQAPIAGCGCYNYCGATFQGCCPPDGICSASCQGLLPDEVLTAGCQLSDEPITCKSYSLSCASGTECCSGRCLFGSCQTPAPKPDARPKLGAGRGGAGGAAKDGGVNRRIKEVTHIRGE
jgi:hypothetical protein